ncbi:hypothetical protein ACT7DF_23470 [Bacillus cereus]
MIDESPGRSLILERQNEEGEIETSHVAFLAAKDMPEISAFLVESGFIAFNLIH